MSPVKAKITPTTADCGSATATSTELTSGRMSRHRSRHREKGGSFCAAPRALRSKKTMPPGEARRPAKERSASSSIGRLATGPSCWGKIGRWCFTPGRRIASWDFDLRLTARAEQVTLGDTKEGTFALRVATPLEESRQSAQGVRRTGTILTADGRTGRGASLGHPLPLGRLQRRDRREASGHCRFRSS